MCPRIAMGHGMYPSMLAYPNAYVRSVIAVSHVGDNYLRQAQDMCAPSRDFILDPYGV